ncbi:PhzF family phenazine biosynthesis protein [Catenisphaera adipataccumulans]|uniref:PhzF family phenazine biosynthesis protein n=1 Tax=Catenisphaera adipataccumulans TaxID=700500 RepID=A0A7W8FWA0_9FIRM|nr:PhzF family phenazine biosynthesis protein [Catenisphaera adipataccumulans]MBB5183026.1 PhzF family phenazine biosynthesis protein [Catenisphaera adipataccumulans]
MKQYIVDAFTKHVFSGNPAAICILDHELSDDLMQKMAIENNLSETAFALLQGEDYQLRWFTPGGEIDLCGHATLASAYVILHFLDPERTEVRFHTKSGVLTVKQEGELFAMDLPSFPMHPIEVTDQIVQAIGICPQAAYLGEDMVCVLKDEAEVRRVIPDLDVIRQLDGTTFNVTARGDQYDCVTRSFAPKCGVAEDPVCGRAHCHVIPYWADQLQKKELKAYQASARGGELYCRQEGERTILRGHAVLYAEADIHLEDQ